jgi:hypothetical protein
MKNKSIISLVSFFLLSMLYVAPAIAGPTYVNITIPKKCGEWKYDSSVSHHCAGTGKGKYVKAGTKGAFKCVGGGNGKGNLMIEMANCPTVIWGTLNVERAASPLQAHGVWLISGNAKMAGNGHPAANTKDWCIMKRRNYRCRI